MVTTGLDPYPVPEWSGGRNSTRTPFTSVACLYVHQVFLASAPLSPGSHQPRTHTATVNPYLATTWFHKTTAITSHVLSSTWAAPSNMAYSSH